MNILADESLPGLAEAFPIPFKLTLYKSNDEVHGLLTAQDILLCRATLKVDKKLLEGQSVRYVATASSGSDNLDRDYLKSASIIPLDAKGCNALSVADYMMSCVAYLDVNHYIQGKKIGIIGLGHVGSIVYNRLKTAGFKLYTYDPLKALHEHGFKNCGQEELFDCDVLCIHAELHNKVTHPSINLIDEQFLSQLKPNCIIINASRGGIVNENALLSVLPRIKYCTDVYINEPFINKELIAQSIICTPHIAGHSIEAKYAAVSIVSNKLHHLLNLSMPQHATPQKPTDIKPLSQIYSSWQEQALALYNPLDETNRLKQANQLDKEFITLRKEHSRHNFATHLEKINNFNIKQVLT